MIDTYLYNVAYLIVLIVGILSLFIISNLYKKYGYKYLLAYFYYIVMDILQGFSTFTWRYFYYTTSDFKIDSDLTIVLLLYINTMWITRLISLYLLLYIVFNLVDLKIPRYLQYAVIGWSLISLSMYAISSINIYANRATILTYLFFYYISLIDFIIKFILFIYLLLYSVNIKNLNKRKSVRILCYSFLFVYLSAILLNILKIEEWDFLILPFDSILYLFPILYLRTFLRKYHGEILKSASFLNKINKLKIKCGISRREMEIIGMILQGKTNQEIERELFISKSTVKNHIYTIYQKIGINSRGQLMKEFITDIESS